jgi:hypothetical protein
VTYSFIIKIVLLPERIFKAHKRERSVANMHRLAFFKARPAQSA